MIKIVQVFCMKQYIFFCFLLASSCLLQAMNDSTLVTSLRAEGYTGYRLANDFAAEQVDSVEQAALDRRLRAFSEDFDARQVAAQGNRLINRGNLFGHVPWIVYKKSYRDERRTGRRVNRNYRVYRDTEVIRNIRRVRK